MKAKSDNVMIFCLTLKHNLENSRGEETIIAFTHIFGYLAFFKILDISRFLLLFAFSLVNFLYSPLKVSLLLKNLLAFLHLRGPGFILISCRILLYDMEFWVTVLFFLKPLEKHCPLPSGFHNSSQKAALI